MPSTLTSLRDRVEAALMDSSNLSWDTATLDEAIRQSLTFITKARDPAAAFTITALDGVVTGTLPEDDTAYLVMGAAGFAARSRSASRSQMANLDQAMPNALLTWSTVQLDAFFMGLGLVGATSTAGSGEGLAIATAQINAAVAAVALANQRTDAAAAAAAARITGLQGSATSPHSALDWVEPKTW